MYIFAQNFYMNTQEIEKRYDLLAEESCCLSCGGAGNHSKPQAGEICADLGCGRGNDVIRLATDVGKTGFVYGFDVSEGMLEKAKKTASKLNVSNVQFVRTDLAHLPLKDNSLDLIISNCTINHTADKPAVWKEIFRVLRQGGRFVVSDIYSSETVPDEYRNDPVAVSECWAGADTKDTYINTLKSAGFKNINILEESKPYAKGKITVSSFTISGKKIVPCCCCS